LAVPSQAFFHLFSFLLLSVSNTWTSILVHKTNVLRLRNIPLLLICTLSIHEHKFTFKHLCWHSITKILRNGPRHISLSDTPRPYIFDRGALHAYVMMMCTLNNSEPTELIFIQSSRLIPNPSRYSRALHAGKLGGRYG
jgi:hypothetical protein